MKLLLKISLSASLIGILILLIISTNFQPKQINIKDINNNLINKKIQVTGEIINIKNYKDSNFQILILKDRTGQISITLNKILNLKKNQNIVVIGTVNQYQGNLQIQADKITSSL